MEATDIRIAIAENHTLLRRSLQVVLESVGFNVICIAENGNRLLEQIKIIKRLPSICIVDISMTVIDGFQTVRHLRQHYPGIKILAMTVFENEKKRTAVIAAGAHDVIIKSESLENWKATITSCLMLGQTHTRSV